MWQSRYGSQCLPDYQKTSVIVLSTGSMIFNSECLQCFPRSLAGFREGTPGQERDAERRKGRKAHMPMLLYGLQCFVLLKSNVSPTDFAVTRFLMKLFSTSNMDIINDFRFLLPSEMIEIRKAKFENKFNMSI